MEPRIQVDDVERMVAELSLTLKGSYAAYLAMAVLIPLFWLLGYQYNYLVLSGLMLASLLIIVAQLFLLRQKLLLRLSTNYGFFSAISVPIIISIYFTGGMFSPIIWLMLFAILFEAMSYGLVKGLVTATVYLCSLWTIQGLAHFGVIPPVQLFPGWPAAAGDSLSLTMLLGYSSLLLVGPLTVGVQSRQLRESDREMQNQQKESALILEASPIIIFHKDIDGKFILVNKTFADSLKLSEKDFIGKTVFDLYPRPIAEAMTADDREVMNFGRPKLNIVESYQAADGLRWVQTDKVPVRDEKGVVRGLIGFAVDITGRKHIEAQLSTAVKMAHLGPWEYDVLKDQFIFNDAFYSVFHTTAQAAGGYTMSSAEYAKRFVHPEDAATVGAEMAKSIQAADPGFTSQVDHRFLYADGGIGYVSVRFYIVKDAQGRTVWTYGINQDITERKQVENELSAKVKELGKITRIMEGREDKIIELKNEIKELKSQPEKK